MFRRNIPLATRPTIIVLALVTACGAGDDIPDVRDVADEDISLDIVMDALDSGDEQAGDTFDVDRTLMDATTDAGPPPPSYRITHVEVEDHITYKLEHHLWPHWTGDLWPCAWGDDDRLYTACGDGVGFGMDAADIVFNVVEGMPPNLTGSTPEDAFAANIAGLWAEDLTLNRKPTGLTCVDGDIYLFSQNLRNGLGDDPFGDAPHASVSVTSDYGLTWEFDADEPMFTDHVFTTGFFLDFGKCQEHRIDDYEYVFGLDYNWRFSDDFLQDTMYLARVHKDQIMDRGQWEFFTGMTDDGPEWTSDIEQRSQVLVDKDIFCKDQSAIAQGHVIFIPQLNRYLYSSRAVCVWIFYEAPEPWGPWTRVSVQQWTGKWSEEYHAGYNVVIPSKFMDEDGRGGWTVTSLSSGYFDGAYYNMGFRRFELETELDND